MEVMPDHIHLLLDYDRNFYIRHDKDYEGNLARHCFFHPELKQELWGRTFVNPSDCAVTK